MHAIHLNGLIIQTILGCICLIHRRKINMQMRVFSIHFETIFAASYLID